MIVIEGDLLKQKGVLCHQVNMQGIMGAGIALQIRERWPKAFEDYATFCRELRAKLGEVVFSDVGAGRIIAHCFGQMGVANRKGCATAYHCYHQMLPKIQAMAEKMRMEIYLPYGIGCGLGGGDWNKLYPILNQYLPDATLVRYKGGA